MAEYIIEVKTDYVSYHNTYSHGIFLNGIRIDIKDLNSDQQSNVINCLTKALKDIRTRIYNISNDDSIKDQSEVDPMTSSTGS